MFNLNSYILATPCNYKGFRVVERILCRDGFSFSVQAGTGHYCQPRNGYGPYTAVEIGYPSRVEPLIRDFAEEYGAPCDTVYGYVPIEIAALVIARHQGAVSEKRILPKKLRNQPKKVR